MLVLKTWCSQHNTNAGLHPLGKIAYAFLAEHEI